MRRERRCNFRHLALEPRWMVRAPGQLSTACAGDCRPAPSPVCGMSQSPSGQPRLVAPSRFQPHGAQERGGRDARRRITHYTRYNQTTVPQKNMRSDRTIAPQGNRQAEQSSSGRRFRRRHPDSNRGWRICSPLPYHLAMPPQGVRQDTRLQAAVKAQAAAAFTNLRPRGARHRQPKRRGAASTAAACACPPADRA